MRMREVDSYKQIVIQNGNEHIFTELVSIFTKLVTNRSPRQLSNMPKHCSWGQCRSDSRYPKEGVTFIPFPKPWEFPEKAKRWAFLCGRGQDFTVDRITKDTYICSLHFAEGSNLNHRKNPDLEPYNARWSQEKVAKIKEQTSRRSRPQAFSGLSINISSMCYIRICFGDGPVTL